MPLLIFLQIWIQYSSQWFLTALKKKTVFNHESRTFMLLNFLEYSNVARRASKKNFLCSLKIFLKLFISSYPSRSVMEVSKYLQHEPNDARQSTLIDFLLWWIIIVVIELSILSLRCLLPFFYYNPEHNCVDDKKERKLIGIWTVCSSSANI